MSFAQVSNGRTVVSTSRTGRRNAVSVSALFGKKPTKAVEKPAKEVEKKESVLSQTLNAFNFSQARNAKDAELLAEAKYGKRAPGGKMTDEQADALRRKVRGSAKDYWKDWVEESQVKNIKTYTKPTDAGGTVPYLPFLIGVVVALLATTVFVVQATS